MFTETRKENDNRGAFTVSTKIALDPHALEDHISKQDDGGTSNSERQKTSAEIEAPEGLETLVRGRKNVF